MSSAYNIYPEQYEFDIHTFRSTEKSNMVEVVNINLCLFSSFFFSLIKEFLFSLSFTHTASRGKNMLEYL